MTRNLLRLFAAAAVGLALSLGAATSASASLATDAAECPSPKWQVSWTTDDAETLRHCGGETGTATEASTGHSELPLTSGPGLLAAGSAVVMLSLGVGMYLATRHQRRTFRA